MSVPKKIFAFFFALTIIIGISCNGQTPTDVTKIQIEFDGFAENYYKK